jgi:hypothetical protein
MKLLTLIAASTNNHSVSIEYDSTHWDVVELKTKSGQPQ